MASSSAEPNIPNISTFGSYNSFQKFLLDNPYTLNKSVFTQLEQSGVTLGFDSSLLYIRKRYQNFFSETSTDENTVLAPESINSQLLRIAPNMGKSRYFSASEIANRLRSAFKLIGSDVGFKLVSFKHANVFHIKPS